MIPALHALSRRCHPLLTPARAAPALVQDGRIDAIAYWFVIGWAEGGAGSETEVGGRRRGRGGEG